MTQSDKDQDAARSSDKRLPDKTQRLADALRANLGRRKAAAQRSKTVRDEADRPATADENEG